MKIKSIISLLCLGMGAFMFQACDDVPSPYDIPGKGDANSIYGNGKLETPYTVNGAKLNQDGGYAWVKAYIVGYIPTGENISSTISDIVFGTDEAGKSNIVIATSADSRDINSCMAVQLPTGDVRNALNLQEHPENIGKEVMLYGTLEKYFGAEGVKNIQAAILNDTEIGEMPKEESGEALFSETLTESLGAFTINNVKPAEGLGKEVWTYDSQFKCAKATSYTGGTDGLNIATESWLVSPAIDLKSTANATLTFEHAANYFNDVKNDVTVWIAEAGTENWTQLSVPAYPVGFTFVKSGDIDLNAYKGKEVKIGFKYVCTTKAGTYELKNVKVEDRAATLTPDTPDDGNSKENPYTVTTAMEKYNATTPQANTWVKGYIVGYISDKSLNENTAKLGAVGSDVVNTNILLADNAQETDYTKCLAIQLSSGNVRNALNLKDHPENLGKSVVMKGSLEKYFGTYGLKSISEYEWENGGSEPGNVILSESFADGAGSFTVTSVSGDLKWNADKKYACMKMSAFADGVSLENEDWLISPAINLSGAATLTFEQAFGSANKSMANAPQLYTVWVSDNYTGDVTTATWTQVTINYPSTSSWTFSSAQATLPAVGDKARLAFKYKNADGDETLTWEIKNVEIK